jgi:hypothetical protein
MSATAEAVLRRRVEAMVDREVERLRRLLELRLAAIMREELDARLPAAGPTAWRDPSACDGACPGCPRPP